MSPQDIADALVGNLVTQIGHCSDDAIVTPARVLARQFHKTSVVEEVLTPPSIVNGKAFVATGSGEVYALSAPTGEVLWKVNIGESISFQPTVAKGRIYVSTNQGSLFCLNTGDGRDDGWLMWGASAAHNGLSAR